MYDVCFYVYVLIMITMSMVVIEKKNLLSKLSRQQDYLKLLQQSILSNRRI